MPGRCCPPPCCPPPCCSPVVIRTSRPKQQGQCCTFQLPPVNVMAEIPPPPRNRQRPTTCSVPIMICEDDGDDEQVGGCCQLSCNPRPTAVPPRVRPPPCCSSPCCPPPCCPVRCCPPRTAAANGNNPAAACGKGKNRREKRWPQCNFLKPCIDTRIYRDGEHMTISYAGHIPGEQFIHGRNLPTTSTFAKRRLCSFTPYEFVDPDGCCSFP